MRLLALLLCLSSLGLTGCGLKDVRDGGDNADVPRERRVDQAAEFAVSEFESLHGARINFAVEFVELPASRVGECVLYTNGQRIVRISNVAKAYASDMLKVIVFHELGHCVLGKDHDNSYWLEVHPNSVMRSWAFNEDEAVFFDENRSHYDANLFN